MSDDGLRPDDGPDEEGEAAVSDAELMRYLHGELSGAERAGVDDRLAAAPAAAARLATLRRRSERLGMLLGAVDPAAAEVRASADALRRHVEHAGGAQAGRGWWGRMPTPLKQAAVVTLLLSGVLVVEPARAWVVERVRDVAAALGVGTVQDVDPPAADLPAGADLSVSFPWDAAVFEVVADAAAGELLVRRGAVGRAHAESVSGGPSDLVVLPGRGLRIADAGAGASWILTLPPAVTTVRVVTPAGAAVHAVPPSGELRIDIAAR